MNTSGLPSVGLRRAVRWRILAILVLISFIAYLFRYNLSVAGPALKTDLGLSDAELALVLSPFIWGYTIFQFPGGIYGQLVGARIMLAVIVAAWGIITLLCGVLPGTLLLSNGAIIGGLLVLRLLMGAAQGPLFPALAGNIAAWFPVGRWALPNSLSSTGATFGAALTAPLIAWLVTQYGWRASFYLTAPVALLVAWFWWWYGRNDPGEHSDVRPEELALIRADRPPQAETPSTGHMVRAALQDPQVMLLSSSYLCMNYIWYIYFSWLVVYLVDVRQFSLLQSGFLAALPWLAGSVAVALGGETCDRLCRRLGPNWGCRIPGMAGLIGSGVLLLAGAAAIHPYLAVALLSLCYASNQFTEGAYWQAVSYLGGRHTAPAAGILNTYGNLAGIIATPLTALLFARFGWTVAFATGSLFAALGALLWLRVRPARGPRGQMAGTA